MTYEQHLNAKITIILAAVALILGIASLAASVLNRKRFKEICVLYKEKYGSLPPMVEIFDDVNTFYVNYAYGLKVQFIFKPLLWNRSSNFTKNNDKDFIRGLPKRLILPFYIEIYLAVVSLMFFVALVVFLKVIGADLP